MLLTVRVRAQGRVLAVVLLRLLAAARVRLLALAKALRLALVAASNLSPVKATKVWFLLSLVILIEAATILVVLNDDTDDTAVGLEQRVKALEGSAASAKDDASNLSKRVERVESQFWE